jgi:hypothetical protein
MEGMCVCFDILNTRCWERRFSELIDASILLLEDGMAYDLIDSSLGVVLIHAHKVFGDMLVRSLFANFD